MLVFVGDLSLFGFVEAALDADEGVEAVALGEAVVLACSLVAAGEDAAVFFAGSEALARDSAAFGFVKPLSESFTLALLVAAVFEAEEPFPRRRERLLLAPF